MLMDDLSLFSHVKLQNKVLGTVRDWVGECYVMISKTSETAKGYHHYRVNCFSWSMLAVQLKRSNRSKCRILLHKLQFPKLNPCNCIIFCNTFWRFFFLSWNGQKLFIFSLSIWLIQSQMYNDSVAVFVIPKQQKERGEKYHKILLDWCKQAC